MQAPANLLFLFPDQWRWDWLGSHDASGSPYGQIPVRTPHLDALAARGCRFTQCRTNSPLCAPARACLAQGVRYEHAGVPDNGFATPVERDNIFRRLRDAGYRVACTGKTDLQKHGGFKGLDGWTPDIGRLGFTESANQCGKWDAINSGRDRPADLYMAHLHDKGLVGQHVADYDRRKADRRDGRISTGPTPLTRDDYTDDVCGQHALEMLERWAVDATGERPCPWLLWVNFPGPHEPFDPPRSLQQRYDRVHFPPPVNPAAEDTPQDHLQIRRNYAAMCEGIDEWGGRLIAAVDARGELDRTLIVFASDHGEMLGDHGHWYKARPGEGSVHVPLLLAGPGVEPGTIREDPVELIDVAATLLHAAQLSIPQTMDARPLQHQAAPPREVQLCALRDWRMICDGRFKLTRYDDGRCALYDLQNDPAETRDLAPQQPGRVRDLSERYDREVAR